jgi:RNA polymerase sigma-70 factor (ECF subfamily)
MEFDRDIEKLVTEAQNGDTDAFGQVFDLLLTPIFRFVFFRIGNKADAEDLTEEVFLKAWQNLNSFTKKHRTPFSAWIFQIAKNTITDHYRSNKETSELSDQEADDKQERAVINPTETEFNKERLISALAQLPEQQAEAVSLRYFSDLTNPEIAEVLNKTEGAVRILISRGLKKLKEILAEK